MPLELTDQESIQKGLSITDEVIDKIIDQPTDGLLYDLDLMPEQVQNGLHAVWSRVIQRLHSRFLELQNSKQND